MRLAHACNAVLSRLPPILLLCSIGSGIAAGVDRPRDRPR